MPVTHNVFDTAPGEFLCHEHTCTFATVHAEKQPPPSDAAVLGFLIFAPVGRCIEFNIRGSEHHAL